MRLRTDSPPIRQIGPLAAALGLTCLLAAGEVLRAQTPPPVITLDEAGIIVSDLTPGGAVAVFGACRRSFDYYERRERYLEILHDDDQDGVVRFEVPEGLPWKSAWVAVDLASGERSIAAPEGWPLEEAAFGQAVSASPRAVVTAPATDLELLWVRPDSEAPSIWTVAASDPNSQQVTVGPELFEPAGGTFSEPDGFAASDVLVAIDTGTLSVYSTRVEG